MDWIVTSGDILDVPTDVLICSANVFLNLSGGVGGEILVRYGRGMQDELHQLLARSGKAFVQQGEVVGCGPHGLPVKAVLHAVAVDAFYQSNPQIVRAVVEKSLAMSAALKARRVALTALATGFGRLSMEKFAEAILPLRDRQYPPIEQVVVCVKSDDECQRLRSAFGVEG